jgi:hypothetical protein
VRLKAQIIRELDRQFRSYEETLRRELRVAPDAEMQALAKEIARSRGADEPDAPEGRAATAKSFPR